ncbi:MAG: T9SS type A sorting domain-containing protein [Flavobacteriales bacterium]|nr:T9SS type A sorting domain-containing protein [Flavobacteriales bacterium]
MKKVLLTLTLAILATFGWSQCEIGFTATVSNDTVILNPYDSSSTIGYNAWNAPGGTPSNQALPITTNATVIYSTAGTYEICVVMYDSGNTCIDTFCDSVTITNGGGSTLASTVASTSASCGSCNGTATVAATGGTTPYYYFWSNGAVGATATGLCAGTYTATVIDNDSNVSTSVVTIGSSGGVNAQIGTSNTNPCAGSTVTLTATANASGVYTYAWSDSSSSQTVSVTSSGFYSVTMTDSNGCVGSDSIYVQFGTGPALTVSSTDETCASCCNGTAAATATGSGLTYLWSNAATTASITGLCPGTYTVTVQDTIGGCPAIDSVTISAYVATCYNIEGEVSQGALVRVYLIQESSGSLSAVDSIVTDSNGAYSFANVCNGTYYVKGAALSTHALYSTIIPTYYDSAAIWSFATSIIVNNASLYGVDFALLSGVNFGGAGFVGGLITQGANRAEGDPISDVYVAAYNADGTLAGFDKSDANGAYSIDNLSLGTYEIYVDVLNKTAYPHIVTLTTETPESPNRDFEVLASVVKPMTPTGIDAIVAGQFEVYPNPASDFITIQSGELVVETISIINVLGERIQTQRIGTSGQFEIELTNVASGSYYIEATGDGFTHHMPIVVQ